MTDAWQTTDAPPPLAPGAVHLWRFALDRPADELARLAALLSDDERSRAERFTFPGLRERFVGARGVLRTILGRYLDMPPERIRFAYNNFGKPALLDEPLDGGDMTGDQRRDDQLTRDQSPSRPPGSAASGCGAAGGGVAFNLSHSGDLALLGIACGREIGVDIERHRPEVNCEQLAEHFFAPVEVAALRALAPGERRAAFFACWSRKEAYIKAVGRGLSTPLDGFAVSLAPTAPAALLWARDAPHEIARWMLTSPLVGEGYSAAVCAERSVHETRQYHWT
jgi:4'-phosphopantetheinyl transferase